jgi:hypothetical protein
VPAAVPAGFSRECGRRAACWQQLPAACGRGRYTPGRSAGRTRSHGRPCGSEVAAYSGDVSVRGGVRSAAGVRWLPAASRSFCRSRRGRGSGGLRVSLRRAAAAS